MSDGISDEWMVAVHAVLRRKAGRDRKVTISLRAIADELGLHVASVHRAMNRLIGRRDIRRIGYSRPMRIEVLR